MDFSIFLRMVTRYFIIRLPFFVHLRNCFYSPTENHTFLYAYIAENIQVFGKEKRSARQQLMGQRFLLICTERK